MATIETQSPPSGWRLTTGTWGTDADLNKAGSNTAFGNDKYVRLKSTAVATTISTGRIPLRTVANTNTLYDITVAYESSSAAGSDYPTVGLTYYNDAGASIATIYLDDSTNTQLDGTNNAPTTNIEYASYRIALVPGASGISYIEVFVGKSATAFTLDVHGIVVRPQLALQHIGPSGTVSVPDNGATWTTVSLGSTGTYRTLDFTGLPANSTRAIIPSSVVHCYAVIKCEDVPSGSEFAVRLSITSLNGGGTSTYEGQRIVSSAGSKVWQISASGIATQNGLNYMQVEAQHNGGGAAGNLTVSIVHGFIHELQPWI